KRCQVSVANIPTGRVLHCSPAAYNNLNNLLLSQKRSVPSKKKPKQQHNPTKPSLLANIPTGRVLHCSPAAYNNLNTISFYLRNVVKSP
ncbi:hypothetical protein J6590_092752, partial [Homalodisca vitripennis]